MSRVIPQDSVVALAKCNHRIVELGQYITTLAQGCDEKTREQLTTVLFELVDQCEQIDKVIRGIS